MLVQPGLAYQACIFSCKIVKLCTEVSLLTKSWGKQLRVRLGSQIHVENISISTDFLGHIHRQTISTRNSIAIINHLSLNTSIFFIKATETYHCLYLFVLWSDLESSRMCRWNKIPTAPFGAHPMFTTRLLEKFIKTPDRMQLKSLLDTGV